MAHTERLVNWLRVELEISRAVLRFAGL